MLPPSPLSREDARMAREGIAAAYLCAHRPLYAPDSLPWRPSRSRDVASALAVQQAAQARPRSLWPSSAQYETAVRVLEQQLSRINGNREYLACLRDAYRGYVKEFASGGIQRKPRTRCCFCAHAWKSSIPAPGSIFRMLPWWWLSRRRP